MKTLVVMLVAAVCAIGWHSPEILHAIGIAESAQDPATISIESLASTSAVGGHRPMPVDEFARLSKSDPQAYRKFIGSYQSQERTEVDKLLNFFARGAYE
ncbi:MAG: hypothetical protein ACREX0_03465 [Noviherbaspirillum sp.]